ncbi:unnamed protein product [Brassicogethes aeneus]|uniref:tRNA pseudouridine(55) synthase n=1 Tax=Brassicogethes aeneus TaxID=1431903 RepID=A0A9P0FI51_BRAAE|nr:unnamed protein product [Brassicogethes aeneus]
MDNLRNNIIEHLGELECCDRCILQHILLLESENFANPQKYFEKLQTQEDNKETNEESKKIKKNICRLCLDMLTDSSLDTFVEAIEKSNINVYKTDDFYVNITYPKSVYIRKHAITLYLDEKYPEFYKDSAPCEIFSKVFKYSINRKISEKLNKKQSQRSNFEINIDVGYSDDEQDVQKFINLDKSKFPYSNKQQYKHISRNIIIEVLNKVSKDQFRKIFPGIPAIPNNKAEINVVKCLAAPIFVGGRYLKFSRKLCQTPWIIGKVKVVELSVQDIIFDAVEKYIGKQEKMTFSSSGREDVDVRMLGNGRPFYIQIDNPKTRQISFEQFRKIEQEILQSKVLAVLHMQLVYKSDINLIKTGEESKKKTYLALCNTKGTNLNEIIEKINNHGPVELAQKTPIRVLHRRNMDTRTKNIYEMTAKPVQGHENLFELEMVTQAGTYVKEFVHGDFERTTPNLGTIVGHACDIITLDVKKIGERTSIRKITKIRHPQNSLFNPSNEALYHITGIQPIQERLEYLAKKFANKPENLNVMEPLILKTQLETTPRRKYPEKSLYDSLRELTED